MNLETRLEPRLWEEVRGSVEARKYTNAILDAVHFLSDVIRERSGLEGDGVSLVGAAFGGSSPKLRVNRLRTESEQNTQRGVEALLRGIYQAIRNPEVMVHFKMTSARPLPFSFFSITCYALSISRVVRFLCQPLLEGFSIPISFPANAMPICLYRRYPQTNALRLVLKYSPNVLR